ncbi:Transcription factor mbp1 [Elasticomyces elasticus]|nr:Transcription factor mbp1 [Elasticomyces elasticus]KAK3653075.1 Transcription factor mbp1 [Elasticomyces elasticus]KAK4919682.1 Transcription factor mbp1 [Elasticomyces elasticus]KAK5749159.1 Transcription factor mbp1 [Elasticomyces elasticus]
MPPPTMRPPASSSSGTQTVYSATYSNVPVYEFSLPPHNIMRRRSDDWINATHILKVADYDKPARTRILEREVQKGVHEKVQGGYGKYQGTWIPLADGRVLAEKNGVFEKLRAIFEYVPGDRSPPLAPKHETAASSKPRAPRNGGAEKRKAAAISAAAVERERERDYEALDLHHARDETPEDAQTVASESLYDDYDAYPPVPQQQLPPPQPPSRKRRRKNNSSPPPQPPPQSPRVERAERDHQLWADELLDYFMLQDPSLDAPQGTAYPPPPSHAAINRPIDEKGHTALHWAAAMGDVEVVKDLIRRGAAIDSQSASGETPLMRAVMFTNCFDRGCMEKVGGLLVRTVNMQDWHSAGTVFHHIAGITASKKKYECARYYLDCILAKMVEILSPVDVERVLNEINREGDTAITIAARQGARKCVRSLIGRNAAVDIMNHQGETADQLIVQLNRRRQERHRQMSSSPFQQANHGHAAGGAMHHPVNGIPFDPLRPHGDIAAHGNGSGTGFGFAGQESYKSEAALTLTSSILPGLGAKAAQLAAGFDAEVREKDAELAEAGRVAELRRGELEGMRRQIEEWDKKAKEQRDEDGLGMEGADEEMEATLAELVKECEGLVEEEERAMLVELIAAEERKLGSPPESSHISASSSSDVEMGDRGGSADGTVFSQLRLTGELVSLHLSRRSLVGRIVRGLSEVGWGDEVDGRKRRVMYRELIEGALGVGEQEVEGLLGEIVGELEGSGGGAWGGGVEA